MNEGQLADYFGPGLHTLDTANLPLLTDLQHWDKGFKSPFKSDVVFFTLKEQVGRKWGTAQPITVRDAEYGAIRLRAFGSYSFRIEAIDPFIKRLFGTMSELTVASLEPQLRAAIQTAIATALGSSGIAFLDLAANQQRLSDTIKVEVDKAFAQWGLSCPTFYVESISLPDEVQAHLDKGSEMRVIGDLSRYTQFQAAEAIEAASHQDGGMAAIGAGVAGAAVLGNVMAQGLAPAGAAAQSDPFEQDRAVAQVADHGRAEPGGIRRQEGGIARAGEIAGQNLQRPAWVWPTVEGEQRIWWTRVPCRRFRARPAGRRCRCGGRRCLMWFVPNARVCCCAVMMA